MNTQAILRRQFEREDFLTTLEQGRKVERALFRENTRGMNTMRDLFWQRQFKQQEDVRIWERWNAYVAGPEIRPAGPNPHQWPCDDPLCDRCDAAEKHLLRDLDLLPKGKKDWLDYAAEEVAERLFGLTRYRRDESDR